MGDSWIKLFRKFLEWEWFHDDAMVKMWLYLLLSANYEDRKWQGKVIKRGQLVTSVPSLMRDLNRTRQQIRTSLLRLVNTKEITLETTNRFTTITICKYDNYQEFNFGFQPAEQPTNNQQITNEQPTNNHQITTPKEIKNIRNKENNIESTNVASTSVGTDASGIDFNSLKDFFNKTMQGRAIPKIRAEISDRRKAMVKARVQQYGIDTVYEVITKAANSSFLNGGGRKGFVADLEWLMRPNNFPKVLEGNYDDRPINHTSYGNNQPNHDSRQAERDKLAADYSAAIARLAAEDDARS